MHLRMRTITRAGLLAFALSAWMPSAFAAPPTREWIEWGGAVGTELTADEQTTYGLLPGVPRLRTAHIESDHPGRFQLHYEFVDGKTVRREERRLTALDLELLRVHIELVDSSLRDGGLVSSTSTTEASVVDAQIRRFAARKEYRVAARIAEDHEGRQIASGLPADSLFSSTITSLRALADGRCHLLREGSWSDRGGRTELLIFSGYYGAWVGIATPIALEKNDARSISAGLLLGAPGAILLAERLTRNTEMGRGRATFISLGGHWGTWQGLGWPIRNDMPSREVLGSGVLTGLVGVGAAALWTAHHPVTEGHAEITASGAIWGAWLGFLTQAVSRGDQIDGDDALTAALIGSDVLLLAGGVLAEGSPVTRGRVRLCNAAGVAGGLFGLGVAAFTRTDSAGQLWALTGAGSLLGLGVAAARTDWIDERRDDRAAALPVDSGWQLGVREDSQLTIAWTRTY